MLIRDCMKSTVYSIPATGTIAEAAGIFARRHIGLLPVLNEEGKPVGMLRLADLLSLELPDFVTLISDLDFVHDFGAVESMRPTIEQLGRPVTTLMQQVKTAEEDCGLLRAYSSMLKNNLLDIPVVNKSGALVGIVSRVDIGAAILSSWIKKEGE